jgi:hypothetical protein
MNTVFRWQSACMAFMFGGCATESVRDGAADEALDDMWSRSVIASDVLVGDVAIKVDSFGVPHVAYSAAEGFENNIKHALLETPAIHESVDGYGRGTSKAWVSGTEDLQLIYDGPSYKVVTFHAARMPAGAWDVRTFTHEAEESAAATAAWYDGRLRVARLTYRLEAELVDNESASLLRYGITYDGQPLPESETRVAAVQVPALMAFAIDSVGMAHIAYSAPADDLEDYPYELHAGQPHTIRYITNLAGRWGRLETLTPVVGFYGGLALEVDGRGRVHVTFGEVGSYSAAGGALGAAFEIVHLIRDSESSEWVRESVPTGKSMLSRGSMAIDATGEVHIAYCSTPDLAVCDSVFHAETRGGAWQTELIQSGCRGLGTQAATTVGPDDVVHVAYTGCAGELMYASRRLDGRR